MSRLTPGDHLTTVSLNSYANSARPGGNPIWEYSNVLSCLPSPYKAEKVKEDLDLNPAFYFYYKDDFGQHMLINSTEIT